LALPFFTLVAAIMETAVVFFAGQVLESAVHDTARMIKTGQIQQIASYNIADFRDDVCERGYGFFTCDQIKVRVRTVGNFASAGTISPIDPDDGTWIVTEQFQPGVGKDIIIAEAYYKWPTVLDLMGFNLATSADSTVLLGGVRVWRNEPFG
jgi:Flp pilus assembly protein TadG